MIADTWVIKKESVIVRSTDPTEVDTMTPPCRWVNAVSGKEFLCTDAGWVEKQPDQVIVDADGNAFVIEHCLVSDTFLVFSGQLLLVDNQRVAW